MSTISQPRPRTKQEQRTDHHDAHRSEPLGHYTDPHGRGRELVRRPGAGGSSLVIDRLQDEPVRRPTTRLTVDEYWRRWWQEEVTVAKARATQYSYRDTYAASIGPRIGELKLREIVEDPQLLLDWRARLAREKSQSALDHAQRVLSSMLSAAADEGLIPYNPLLLLSRQGFRGRA